MPIRFRCVYCGQLLAIATRKAGQEVDCPKCSHPNKVPLEDESPSAPPTREPKISRAFESRKFDKWLGREPQEPSTTPRRPVPPESDSAEVEAVSDQLERASASETLDRGASSDSASAVEEPWRTDPEILPTSRGEGAEENAITWVSAGSLAMLAVVLLLVAFALGILVGRNVFPAPVQGASPPSARPVGELTVEEPKPAPPTEAFSLSGTISFEAADGALSPDVGTVVLALPSQSVPPLDKRFAVDGLRPGDANPDDGRTRIESWGARIAQVSPNGEFTLPLPLAQPYWILILSANAKRKDAASLFPTDQATIEQYFPDARQLLGEREYLLVTKIPRAGQTLNPLDYRFGKPTP